MLNPYTCKDDDDFGTLRWNQFVSFITLATPERKNTRKTGISNLLIHNQVSDIQTTVNTKSEWGKKDVRFTSTLQFDCTFDSIQHCLKLLLMLQLQYTLMLVYILSKQLKFATFWAK